MEERGIQQRGSRRHVSTRHPMRGHAPRGRGLPPASNGCHGARLHRHAASRQNADRVDSDACSQSQDAYAGDPGRKNLAKRRAGSSLVLLAPKSAGSTGDLDLAIKAVAIEGRSRACLNMGREQGAGRAEAKVPIKVVAPCRCSYLATRTPTGNSPFPSWPVPRDSLRCVLSSASNLAAQPNE